MAKLTDAQLVILSNAAKRDDRLILPLSKSLKLNQGALASVFKSLIAKGFVEEKQAKRDEAHWREDDGRRMALAITDLGLKAIGIGDGEEAATQPKPAKQKTKPKPKAAKAGKNKTDRILDLLRRSNGASIEELQACTGWQPHSVRAALTGLRKKGIDVALVKLEGEPSIYRVAGKR